MTQEINNLIEQLTGEIAVRQDALTALHKLRGAGAAKAPTPKPSREENGKAPKRGPKKRAVPKAHQRMQLPKVPGAVKAPVQQGSITKSLDKPDTVGGAMKQIIRGLKPGFDLETVRAALKGDADFAKLHAGNPSGLGNNFEYWTKTGKLVPSGNGFAIGEPEFFAP